MKITKEDYEALNQACLKVLETYPDVRGIYIRAGSTFTRFSWDVMRASKYDCINLYHYLNDSHIDTALSKILDRKSYEAGI